MSASTPRGADGPKSQAGLDFSARRRRVGAPQREIEVVNPFDGGVVGRVRRFTTAETKEAIATVRGWEPGWSGHERATLLGAAAGRLAAERERFELSIVTESGLARRDAAREVSRAVGTLEMAAAEVLTARGEAMQTDITPAKTKHVAVALREPIGVVCAITPFNRPLNQVVVKLAPALAAGNRVVLKPSELTPITALAFVDLLKECGLPADAIAVVTGDPEEIGTELVTSPAVDMVTFTGSAAVGREIAKRIGMIRGLFELGDSGALIVMPGSDLAAAAQVAAEGAFASAGQSCRGVKRIVADEAIVDELVALIAARARALRVGDPLDPDTDIGTLIHEDAARSVEARLAEAVEAGATMVVESERDGAQIGPVVLDRVPRDCPLVQKETFGPCAPVIRVSGLEDAIDCVNGTEFGLQAGVFVSEWDQAWRAGSALRVGAVVINGGPQFDSPKIPFGGVKSSGLGREGVRFAIEEMSRVKTLVLSRPDGAW